MSIERKYKVYFFGDSDDGLVIKSMFTFTELCSQFNRALQDGRPFVEGKTVDGVDVGIHASSVSLFMEIL